MSESRLQGGASPAGTRRGAESFDAGARTLGRTGLTVSPIGFGGARLLDASPVHRRALSDALRCGVNLVDTSTNYGDGASERLVGRMVANLVQQGELRRDQLVVVSKVGYAPAQAVAQYEGATTLADGAGHCLHPDFLEAQLQASLERIGLDRLDVLLLHNPEVDLAEAIRGGADPASARAALHTRLEAAFAWLERTAAAGTIGWYGVASNGLAQPADADDHLALGDVVALARKVGGETHHLGVVELPLNLLELGGLDGGEAGALAVATQHDLGVLGGRPLETMVQLEGEARPIRLAHDVGTGAPEPSDEAQAFAALRKLEAAWATGLGKAMVTEDGSDDAGDLFRWGRELSQRMPEITSLEQWRHLRHEVIAQHLGQTSAALLSALDGDARAEFAAWWERYGTAMHQVFTAVERRLSARRDALLSDVVTRLDPHLPAPWRSMSLACKAVLAVLSAPVGCVVVGMREPREVHEMLALRDHPVRLLTAAAGAVDLRAIGADLASLR